MSADPAALASLSLSQREPAFAHTVVDLGVDAAADEAALESGGPPPSFFVMQSATTLFAGVPGFTGRADEDDPLLSTFHTPADLVMDLRQQLFVADAGNARIRRIAKNGGRVSTVASIGGGDGEVENRPQGLAFGKDGTLYILQTGAHHHIFSISAEGKVSQVAGNETIGGGHLDAKGSLYRAAFREPRATGVDSKGRLYICEKGNSAVRRIDLVAKSVETLLDSEGKPLDLLSPEGIAVDQFDDIYVADTGHHRILRISPRETSPGVWVNDVVNYCGKKGVAGYENGAADVARLDSPTGLAIDKQNHLWICDTGNRCVRMMSYRSELLFTISGRGSPEQDSLYRLPTSLALSYDAMYGAELAPNTPDEVACDPTHPLYYSYVTPIVFVADAEAHCIRKVHTILMEGANALIEVMNQVADAEAASAAAPSADGTVAPVAPPTHNALSYADTSRRDELVGVLLQLKPQLLQQKDNEGRLPIHIAMLESSTLTAGSIALETLDKMLDLAKGDSLAVEDNEGHTPIYYAMQQMSLHAFNEAEAGLPPPTPEAPSAAMLYSRELIGKLIQRQPEIVSHPCLRGTYTLHWMLYQGFGLEVLKSYVAGLGANPSPNPFLDRDQHGRQPLHVACMLHGEVDLEVVHWLVEQGRLAHRSADHSVEPHEPLQSRDNGVLLAAQKTNPRATAKDVPVTGHYPLFYACTNPADAATNASAVATVKPARRTPLYSLDEGQMALIQYLLHEWPQAILQNEGDALVADPAAAAAAAAAADPSAPVPSSSTLPSRVALADGRIHAREELASSFFESAFLTKALALVSLFLQTTATAFPGLIDKRIWHDAKPMAVSEAVKARNTKAKNRALAKLGPSAPKPPPPDLTQPNMYSMLHAAAVIADANLVECILRAGANPFQYDLHEQVLPVDVCADPKVVLLIRSYMDVDPRRPDDSVELATVGVQTGPDSALEAARQKLQEKEEALRDEQARLAQKQRSMAQELEEEKRRLREREERIALETQEEREAVQRRADEALMQKTAEMLATQQKLVLEIEAEKARLRTKEQEALDALAARNDEDRVAMKQRLQLEFEQAKRAIALKQEEGLRRLEEEREAERERSAMLLEAERAKLEAERLEKLGLVEHERKQQEARFKALEEENRIAREEHALRSQQAFQEQFELEKEKLAKQYDARLAQQEKQMEEEVRIARVALENQKSQWEASLHAERTRLQEEFEARRARLEQEEVERLARVRQDDAERRAAYEAEKRDRAAREEKERAEFNKRSALNREEQKRADAERAARFAAAEAERTARWEEEERARAERHAREQKAFQEEQQRLAAESEVAMRRMEAEHAAKLEHEQMVLDELRQAFEHDKAEQVAAALAAEKSRMQAAFDMDRAAIQKAADKERKHYEARATEDAARLSILEAETERLRRELETQIRDKHAAQRQSHQRAMQVAKLEQSLEVLQAARQVTPIVRVTGNPLDVDPLLISSAELPAVAENVGAFGKAWLGLSFRSLLALLLAIPYSQLPRAVALLKMYFQSHPGAGSKVDETTGMLPLHMAAAARLYRELVDVVLKEHPLALRAEDRSGAYPLFYAAAYREGREEARAAQAKRNALANGQSKSGSSADPNGAQQEDKEDPFASEYSLETIRRQGLDLIRFLMLKFPDSIYLPNRTGGARALAKEVEEAAQREEQAAGMPKGTQLPSAIAASTSATSLVNALNPKSPASSPSSKTRPSSSKRRSSPTPSPSAAAANSADPFALPAPNAPSLSLVEYAMEFSDLPLLNLLLEVTSGDFLNACDSRGASYLHRAAAAGKLVLAQWLVEIGGINPWTLCQGDRTPLEYCDSKQHEGLALYLTREMAKLGPEHRVKARKGARRMLIREWSHQDEEDDAQEGAYLGHTNGANHPARSIGGRDAHRPFQPLLDPASLTPRTAATLRPVRTGGRGGPDYSPPLAATAAPTHTTHIHVYGDAAQRMLTSGGGGGGVGAASKTVKRLALESTGGGSHGHGSDSNDAPSSRTPNKHSYHWEFLPERSKHPSLQLIGAASPVPARGRSSSQQQQQMHEERGASPVAQTLHSLQSTSTDLHQLLTGITSPSHGVQQPPASSPYRHHRAQR